MPIGYELPTPGGFINTLTSGRSPAACKPVIVAADETYPPGTILMDDGTGSLVIWESGGQVVGILHGYATESGDHQVVRERAAVDFPCLYISRYSEADRGEICNQLRDLGFAVQNKPALDGPIAQAVGGPWGGSGYGPGPWANGMWWSYR